MSIPGMGVMLSNLFSGDETSKTLQAAHGKRITALYLDAEDDALHFALDDGTKFKLYDNGQSCCESRYMQTDDDLAYYVGALFIEARVQDAPSIHDENGQEHEVQFLIVKTSKGEFTVQSHNEHNGYYGGFAIVCATE